MLEFNEKIVMIDYISKKITIIHSMQINHDVLEEKYNNSIEEYLTEEHGYNSNMAFFCCEDLNIEYL
tara:strand:+ start:346 stop:546 length:201 start_codon:yes stop_codon:yes gene_type:complete